MLTAQGSEAIAVRALKLGAAHYLNFEDTSPRRLSECVGALLESHGSAPASVEQAGRAGETGSGARSRGSNSASRGSGSYTGEAEGLRVPGYRVLRKLADGGMAAIVLAVRAETSARWSSRSSTSAALPTASWSGASCASTS